MARRKQQDTPEQIALAKRVAFNEREMERAIRAIKKVLIERSRIILRQLEGFPDEANGILLLYKFRNTLRGGLAEVLSELEL